MTSQTIHMSILKGTIKLQYTSRDKLRINSSWSTCSFNSKLRKSNCSENGQQYHRILQIDIWPSPWMDRSGDTKKLWDRKSPTERGI